MIPLRSALSDYLSTRRSLGYKLRRTEKLLLQFIDYVEANCADRIATDLALSWARLPVGGDVSWWSPSGPEVAARGAFLVFRFGYRRPGGSCDDVHAAVEGPDLPDVGPAVGGDRDA